MHYAINIHAADKPNFNFCKAYNVYALFMQYVVCFGKAYDSLPLTYYTCTHVMQLLYLPQKTPQGYTILLHTLSHNIDLVTYYNVMMYCFHCCYKHTRLIFITVLCKRVRKKPIQCTGCLALCLLPFIFCQLQTQ